MRTQLNSKVMWQTGAKCSVSLVLLMLFTGCSVTGCSRESTVNQNSSANDNTPANASLPQEDITIGEHSFRVWVADDVDERADGFMYFTDEQLEDLPDGSHRGMLFVFPGDQPSYHGFWMKNTYVALDIAYINSDFEIVTIRTMAPLDEHSYYSDTYYRYALEVKANLFSRLGIEKGDTVSIPESALHPEE